MLCGNCKKNQATKTYEQIKKGRKQVDYYCLECYHKLFLGLDGSEDSEGRSQCPYCGTTVAEFKKRNLVGCANCYAMLKSAVIPVITKMQGAERHKGKSPDESQRTKTEKRRYELQTVAEKYESEKDFESARAYEERLSQLENGIEEDYVWRNRLLLSKRS